MWILYGIFIAIAALIIVLLVVINIRAIIAGARRNAIDNPRKNVSSEKLAEYAENLSELIRCQTIADGAHSHEFVKFRAILERRFPLIHKLGELKVFGGGCLVFKISGENTLKNIMLMSHHDVVKADGEWQNPPFGGLVSEGVLWGRGTVDTKTPLFAQLTAVEELLSEGFVFSCNVYIGSSHNEEICGDGIPLAVEYFKANNIRFDSVLDEGGAIVQGMMPGVGRKSAMVAVHEKGRHVYKCVLKTTDKGHLGLNPAKFNVIEKMSAFVCRVQRQGIFKGSFYPEVKEMFAAHTPYMGYPLRLLFANFGLFGGLLLKIMPKVSTQVGAMLGTTMNFTSVNGCGETSQIQAKSVAATAFFRCVREQTLHKELAKFKKIAQKYGIEVDESLRDYCCPFSSAQPQFAVLKQTLNANFPDVIVSPYLLTAGTDARHFTDIADCILRFAPIDLSTQQFASVHNPNENICVPNIGECVCFYKDYVKNSIA